MTDFSQINRIQQASTGVSLLMSESASPPDLEEVRHEEGVPRVFDDLGNALICVLRFTFSKPVMKRKGKNKYGVLLRKINKNTKKQK
ncbi:hypothetical protein AALB39_17100 [Lachnospiraceae bacterium 54-53]